MNSLNLLRNILIVNLKIDTVVDASKENAFNIYR